MQRRHPLGTLLEVLIYGGAARLVLAGYPFRDGASAWAVCAALGRIRVSLSVACGAHI